MFKVSNGTFYVYAYLDPRKSGVYKYGHTVFQFEPFYIGKGGGGDHGNYKRYMDHLNGVKRNDLKRCCNQSNYDRIREILSCGKEPIIKIIKRFGFEEFSYTFEAEMISLIGRSDLNEGPLTNKSDGPVGQNMSEETRKKISESLKGNRPWNKYKCIPDYQKKSIKETLLFLNKDKVIDDTHDLRPIHVIKPKRETYIYSEERRRKISEGRKGIRSKYKGVKTGKPAWNKGMRMPGKPKTKEECIKARDSVLNTKVAQYTIDGELIGIYRSQRDAARVTGFNREGIKDCCNGRQLSAYGYVWKKLNERYRKELA